MSSLNNEDFIITSADDDPYRLVIDNLGEEGLFSTGQKTIYTDYDNPVNFNFCNVLTYSAGITFVDQSELSVDYSTPISGIKRISFKNPNTDASFYLSSGWDEGSDIEYVLEQKIDVSAYEEKYVDLEYKPDYFSLRFDENISFSSIEIEYECASNNPIVKYDGFKLIYNFENDEYSTSEYFGSSTDIVFPSEYNGKPITKINDHFAMKVNPTSVTIPGSYKHIGENFCEKKSNLMEVNLSEGLESIGFYSFSGCPKISTFTIPDSVKTIKNIALNELTNCTNFVISENSCLETIGDGAFNHSKITSLFIPKNVVYLSESLYGCEYLTDITVDNRNTNYASENGIVYNKNKTALFSYPSNKMDTEYVMPNTVTEVKRYSLCNSYITSLTLSSSLIIFGSYNYLEALDTLNWNGAPVSELHTHAFSFTQLEHIDVPESVYSMGGYAISENKNLISVSLPSSLQCIYGGTLCNNPNLESVTFAGTVEEFEEAMSYSYGMALTGNDKLTEVVCSNGSYSLD